MKKDKTLRINPSLKIILFLISLGLYSLTFKANPGDTTWITVFNQKQLTHYGDYDTTANFPTGKRFRKIKLHYILGRYACPAGSQYCGSWDYTTQIYARPAGKDSVEIARVITPYATDWLTANVNKKHDYIVDVTDYASVLDGTTAMRFNYSGYSWGFTITLKLEMIEGIPPMDALSVKNIYDGYFPFGNANNSIENYLTAKTFSYAPSTGRAFIKNTVSGHGADDADCAEFCSKYYQLNLNNTLISQKQLWRADCGSNEVYPQTGTWIYERGNWCPGAVVGPIYHEITNITSANTNFTVDINMQPYVGAGSLGGYNYVTQLISYSVPNFTTDVSIEDIIAPTNDDNYLRENPNCLNPMIKIKNVGTATVSSIVFNYGLKGGTTNTLSWVGNLAFLDTAIVIFPPSAAILSGSISNVFQVSIASVNGNAGDQNLFNNIYSSTTKTVSIFPKDFLIRTLTNHDAHPTTQKSETAWTLYNETGSVVFSRSPMDTTTFYTDTLLNLAPGCYKFVVTDFGCDGYAWWANSAGGNGQLYFERLTGAIFNTFSGDFGCGFTKYFTVANPNPNGLGIATNFLLNDIQIFPNPASNSASIKFNLNKNQDVIYKLNDISGRIIYQKKLNKITNFNETLDLNNVSTGVYLISFELENKTLITKKLIIQK